jgi:hypothetical protein
MEAGKHSSSRPRYFIWQSTSAGVSARDHDDRFRSITRGSATAVKRTGTGQHVPTRWHSDGIASVRTDGDREVRAVDADGAGHWDPRIGRTADHHQVTRDDSARRRGSRAGCEEQAGSNENRDHPAQLHEIILFQLHKTRWGLARPRRALDRRRCLRPRGELRARPPADLFLVYSRPLLRGFGLIETRNRASASRPLPGRW